jgi:hypothetical protein
MPFAQTSPGRGEKTCGRRAPALENIIHLADWRHKLIYRHQVNASLEQLPLDLQHACWLRLRPAASENFRNIKEYASVFFLAGLVLADAAIRRLNRALL